MDHKSTLVSRAKQTKKNLAQIEAATEEARLHMMACETALAAAREDANRAKDALYNADSKTEFRPYEPAPTDDIEDIGQWSLEYRRRVWGTAFAGGFGGKTGTRDMMLLLSLAHLMETAGTRVFAPTLAEIVRVAAMDKNTVVLGLQSLRESGFLLRVEAAAYALCDLALIPLTESPHLPLQSLANRFFCGDRAHDAFGGMYGLKITEIRVWVWILYNPGQTRYAVAKGAGVGIDTANRAVTSLIGMRLAHFDSDEKCFAKGENTDAQKWMERHTEAKSLDGKLDERIKRMDDTHYFRAKTRLTQDHDLDFG